MRTVLSMYHHKELLRRSYNLTNHEKEFLQVLNAKQTFVYFVALLNKSNCLQLILYRCSSHDPTD